MKKRKKKKKKKKKLFSIRLYSRIRHIIFRLLCRLSCITFMGDFLFSWMWIIWKRTPLLDVYSVTHLLQWLVINSSFSWFHIGRTFDIRLKTETLPFSETSISLRFLNSQWLTFRENYRPGVSQLSTQNKNPPRSDIIRTLPSTRCRYKFIFVILSVGKVLCSR